MTSERLTYCRLTHARVDEFHALVQDDHVRRYLMDGQLFPREWSEERICDSLALFERRGVGLWLAHEQPTAALVGFCGFLEIPSVHPEPQLVYAMFERFAAIAGLFTWYASGKFSLNALVEKARAIGLTHPRSGR